MRTAAASKATQGCLKRFGKIADGHHVAIAAIDLTSPEREDRLNAISPVSSKFEFIAEKLPNQVKTVAAVKLNGVDTSWEQEFIRRHSNQVFDIVQQRSSFVDAIAADLK